MEDKFLAVYDGLRKNNPDMPDYSNFKSDMQQNEQARMALYDGLKRNNPDMPDFDVFSKDMGLSVGGVDVSDSVDGVPDLSDLQKQYDDFRASNKDFMDGYEKRNVGKHDNIPVYGAMGGLGPATFLFKTDSQKKDDERYNEIVRQGEEYKRAIDTHPDVVERRNLMLDRINQSVSDTDELIKGKMKNVPVFSRAYSGGLGVKSEDSNDREIKNLQMANKMYRDAEELLKAPSKYDDSNPFVNFLKGAGDAFNNRDFWSFGLTEIGRNMHMKKIVEKLSGNEEGKNVEDVLSPDELKMLDAFTLLGAVSAERANDLSLGYSAAQSSVESLKFMAEFLLTRGASGMASSAAKKAVSKWLVKNTARNGLARNLGKGLVWGTDATLSTLARTPLMPSTYANVTDRMVGYDEDGMPVVKNVSDALLDGFVDSFIENLSEMSGAHVAGALGIGAKQAGKLVPRGLREGFDKALQSIDRSKLGSLRKAVFNPKVSAFLKETGYNGIGEEMLEEWYGNVLRSVINDPDALKNFATWDNQLMTFFSFAPVALTGGVVSTVSNVRAENRYKNSVSALDKVLRELGADDNGVERFMNNLDGNGTEKDADSLNSLMSELAENDEKKGKELFAAMGEYLYSRSKYKVLNDGWREQMEAKKEAEDARLRDETGGYVNETTGQVDVVVDSEGNTGFITGETGEGEHKVYVVNVNGEKVPVSNKDFNQEDGWQRVSSQDKDSFVEQAVIESEVDSFYPLRYNGVSVRVLDDSRRDDGTVVVEDVNGETMRVSESELGMPGVSGEQDGVSLEDGGVQSVAESQDSQPDDVVGVRVPVTEDGKPDYDSMTPEMFADEFEKEFGADAARGELEQMAADIDAQVEKLQKKSLTNRNERADNMREITRLKGEQEGIRKALERYAVQEEGVHGEPVRDDAPVFSSDEEATRWVIDNSDDVNEVLGTYEAVNDLQNDVALPRWQQELQGMKINPESFYRFGDRNLVGPGLRSSWLRRDGRGVDEVARDLSDYGVEVTPQDVVDFIVANPSGRVRQKSGDLDALGQRFSELATRAAGVKIGRPESPTGRLFIENLRTSNNMEQLRNQINDAQRAEEEVLRSMAEQRDAERENISDDVDENGRPFVMSSKGSTVFGEIREDSGLPPAPIKLSEGYQDENGKGYGLAHIEANHGEQIRKSGFDSVEDFVSYVAENYDENNIRVGKRRNKVSPTYLIQVVDSHDNTLFIELSGDGSYWNVNSAGIFRKGYSNKKETVAKTEPQQPNNAVSSGSSLSMDENNGITSSEPNSEPTVSNVKDSESSVENQEKSRYVQFRYLDGGIHFGRVVGEERGKLMIEGDNGRVYRINEERMLSEYADEEEMRDAVSQKNIQDAEADVDVSPTPAQKDAGNYRKGHIKLDGYDITIENPKGSERSGVDVDGNPWSTRMNNTYGYIRGTKGVDGDHIDVFLSDNPQGGNVYVVDQLKDDGSFDEHKVMYGFSSMDEARDAYLSNYSSGWKGLGAITEVSKDEFRKWVDSSKRKTKPFSEYKNVKVEDSQIDSPLFRSVDNTTGEEGKSGSPLFREGESDRILFREVEDNDGGKSLVGIHNISEEKMRKALRQGGLANPSSAVIDVDKQTHTGYGAISLVMPSSMVDKRTGRNAGTFEGDAWTPTYPQVEKQFSEDGSKRASEDISSVPKDMQSVVRQAIDSFMDGRDARGLSYLFLHERGEAPDMMMVENKYGDKTRDAIIEATGGGFSLVNLDKDAKDKIIDVYIEENFNGYRAAYEEYLQKRIEILKNNLNHERSLVRKRAQEDLTSIEEYGFDYRAISNFVESVGNDVRNGGKVDSQRTILEAIKQMEERGLEKEFSEWKDGLNDRYHVEEVIFDGFTPSGNRRYVKNTLENVSKLMKKQGRAGATGFTAGFSRFAASLMKAKGSLKDIRKSKNKLTDNHADVDAFRDKWSEVFFDLGSKLQPDARGYDDYGLARLQEASTKSNPKKYIKDEYGIDFSDEDVKRLNDMVDAILNEYPAMYFETKFERPVYLNEFAAAIVPDNINANVRGALMNAGLQIFDYKEGDEQSRQAAVQEASNIEGVRFRREASMDASVEDVNRRFNEELDAFESDEHKGDLHLGMPGDVLLASGLNDTEMYITPKTLKDHLKKHGLSIGDIKNLPSALRNPLLVYEWGDKAKSLVVITNIEHDKGRITAAIKLERNGKRLEVNELASVHPKDNRRFINDMINAKRGGLKDALRYVSDKKKALDWLGLVPPKGTASLTKQELSIANVIENFENPTLEDGKIVSAVESLADDLNAPVRIVRNVNEIKDKDAEQELKKRGSKGWYDPKTGEVVIVLPNANDVRDAQATVLHEIVGHKGIRGLFGDKIGYFTKRVLDAMPEAERKKWVDRYNGNEQLAAEEYVAQFAEGYENPGMWEKIVAIVRDLLRDLGIDLRLSDNDLKYTLWRGVRSMQQDGTFMGASEYAAKDREIQRTLFREESRDDKFADKHLSLGERVRESFQDRMLSVKMLLDEVEKRGGKVTDYANPYVAENMATSKSKAQIDDFNKRLWEPLMDYVKGFTDKGKMREDVDRYMMAKHAPERNALLSERDGVENGSGMTDADAAKVVSEFEKDFGKDYIESFWNNVREATRFTTDTWRKHGLIDKVTKDYYDNMYQYYVPLRGWETSEADNIEYLDGSRKGGSVNVNKMAKGRSSLADSPLAYIANMAHSAIVAGNKNDVKRNVFEMMALNKNPDLYHLKKVYQVNTGTEESPVWVEQLEKPAAELWNAGRVKMEVDRRNEAKRESYKTKQHQVEVFVNGQKYVMEFNGNMGVQVANAINGVNVVHSELLQDSIGRVTRWMSANFTSRNPEFVVTNFLRDFGYAVPAYWMKGGKAGVLLKNMPKAFRAIHHDLAGKKVDSDLQKMYEEFKMNGGLTGYVHMTDIDSYKKWIERDIRRMSGDKTFGDVVLRNKAMRAGADLLEYLAQMSENSTRFAVYMSERQAGRGVTDAAYAAKEITTNFNRKGRYSSVLGSLYGFFNATVQGSANALGLARRSPGKFSVYCGSLVALQLLASSLCRMFGGDDEIGENNYDRLADWVKYNNLVLPDPGHEGRFVTIPLPHFFRALSSLGVIAGEVANGVKTAGTGIEAMFDAVSGDLTPVEIATPQFKNLPSFLMSVTPTGLKPITEAYAFNRNFMNLPVAREAMGDQKKTLPQHQLAKKTTNPTLVSISKWLNERGGGGEYTTAEISYDADTGDVGRSGWRTWMDVNPAKFEHVFEGIFGGRLKFFNNVYKTVDNALKGEFEASTTPVVRPLYQSPKGDSAWIKFYEVRDEVVDIDAKASEFMKTGSYDAYGMINYRNARLVKTFKAYEGVVKSLNDALKVVTDVEQAGEIERRRDEVVREFAIEVKKLESEYSKRSNRIKDFVK